MFELLKHTDEVQRLETALQQPGASALFGLPPMGQVQVAAQLANR